MGKKCFEELQSLHEDSSMFFDNAPVKKNNYQESNIGVFSRECTPVSNRKVLEPLIHIQLQPQLQKRLFDNSIVSSCCMSFDSVQTDLIRNKNTLN